MIPEIALKASSLRYYQAWKEEWLRPNLTLWDYLGARGTVELAAVFSKLFWPEFVEVERCILLAEQYDPEHFDHWRTHLRGDREAIERIINHVHIWDLFPGGSPGDGNALHVAEYVAGVLLKSWECALKDTFPDRTFDFYYATEPDDYGPTIAFFQTSKSGSP